MLNLKAIHTIYRTSKPGKAGDKKNGIAPVPPVTEEIQPGKRFTCSDEDGAFFLKTGAAVHLGTEETFAPQTVYKEPAPKEPEPKTESSLSEEGSELLAGDSDRSEDASAPEGEEDLVG
ncbi:MAG: hypothetical protein PHS57_08565 [Alphaproteobacteria bacterium]|nr:hypothetical protein [Alphaproteobacteria bacterium]